MDEATRQRWASLPREHWTFMRLLPPEDTDDSGYMGTFLGTAVYAVDGLKAARQGHTEEDTDGEGREDDSG